MPGIYRKNMRGAFQLNKSWRSQKYQITNHNYQAKHKFQALKPTKLNPNKSSFPLVLRPLDLDWILGFRIWHLFVFWP